MKKLILVLGLFVIPLNHSIASEPFAIVELFASEGCSSCPPADALLIKLTEQAEGDLSKISLEHPKRLKQVFTLTFAVDYWDYLGWKDPFSKPQFTQRQHQYAKVLRSSSIYTPQMIINGQEAFVGSDEAKARKYTDQFLKIPSSVKIDLKSQLEKQNVLKITYQLNQLPPGMVINFALINRYEEISVKSGENAGRVLKHANIVLDFKTIDLDSIEGEIEFTSVSNMDTMPSAVVAYIQDNVSMKILAASSMELSK